MFYKISPTYQKFALNSEELDDLIYSLGSVKSILADLQLESAEMKLHIRNFFVWLNKSTCNIIYADVIKNQGENETEIENTKSHLVKFQPDLRRLNRFLSDSYLFNMHNLQAYYNDRFGTEHTHYYTVFNSRYLTGKRDEGFCPSVPVALDLSIVERAMQAMTKSFTDNFKELTGQEPIAKPKITVESEQPVYTLQDSLKSVARVWASVQGQMATKLSVLVRLKQTHAIPRTSNARLTLVRSFRQEGEYTLAFIADGNGIIVFERI
jgi:hypothetical protein